MTRATLVATSTVAGAVWYKAWKNSTYLFLMRQAPTEAAHPDPAWQGSTVRRYRPLGYTGINMSDISFGGAGISDPDVVTRAVERGINYFDTSPDYSQTGSEQVIGKALKPHRDKVFVASKFCTGAGHLPKDTPVPEIIAAVEGSLKRLQTDYLDVCIIHETNSLDRLMAPTFHEAFDRLKEQGKVRFLGVSSHTPNLEEVMRHAVDSGRFHDDAGRLQLQQLARPHDHLPRRQATRRRRRRHEDAQGRQGDGAQELRRLRTAPSARPPSSGCSAIRMSVAWWCRSPTTNQIDEYLYASGAPLKDSERRPLTALRCS